MEEILAHALIVIAAVGGLALTLYIRRKKARPEEAMVCPMGHDCKAVITSEYSRFLGIPNDVLGMSYYGLVAIVYGALLATPGQTNPVVLFIMIPITLGAFLFSLYLTFIQAFTLRQWCTWCLVSAGLSTIIFFITVYSASSDFIPYLVEFKRAIVGAHLLGLAFGLGGATIADVFFFRFLKDLRISQQESDLLGHISQIIWFGLGLLVLSGVGIFLINPAVYLASDKFLAKMVIVAVIIINGSFLNLYITPKLIHISFGDKHKHHKGELRDERRMAFAAGAISMVSWYSAFVLGMLRSAPVSFAWLLGIYLVLIGGAVGGSQVAERIIARRGWHLPESSTPPAP